MPTLSELAREAAEHGMTYGQYMVQRERAETPPHRHIPGLKRCAMCGKVMDFKGARKFCPDCRVNANAEA